MNEPVPKSVGAYHVIEQIARGGMALVYRAEDRSKNLEVALKVLNATGQKTANHLQSMHAPWEGEIAVQFDHDNVLHTYECGSWKDTYFIAAQLLDWSPLAWLIRDGSPLVEKYCYPILYQIARGLTHIHERGFIHRDMCPKNVLIAQDGSPKIIDFSLTLPMRLADRTRDTRSGTPGYMAPEIVRAQSVDARVDIYAFGVTMYEVLTGVRPFGSESREERLQAHLNSEVPPPSRHEPSIAPAIDALVMRAMAKEPGDRFSSMTSMLLEMRKVFPKDALVEEPVMKRGPKERRFVRIDDECFVRMRVGLLMRFFREIRTVTRNFSLSGMCCVALKQPLEPKVHVEMDLQLRGDPESVPICGQVAWCKPTGPGEFDVGIAFTSLPAAARNRLRQYIAAHLNGKAS